MSPVDKSQLLALLVAHLTAELGKVKGRAQREAEGATHEEARAESDKDMRATEASYVARGLAERALRLEQALVQLSRLTLLDCRRAGTIQASALVEVEHEGQRSLYFLVPAGGGEHLTLESSTGDTARIQTLTPTSPLGRALLGLGVGDEADVETPQGTRAYEVVDLWRAPVRSPAAGCRGLSSCCARTRARASAPPRP
jgi:transcription elongation GreA/GreB family factor